MIGHRLIEFHYTHERERREIEGSFNHCLERHEINAMQMAQQPETSCLGSNGRYDLVELVQPLLQARY